MLTINQLAFSYGSIRTLQEVNMDIKPGRITCVIGRNGVGKTTLLKNIMGVLKPTGGSLILDGQDITSLSANKRAHAGLGMVPQGRQIFPRLTVEENLLVGLEAASGSKRRIPPEVLEIFPVLQQMLKRMGGDLSGGQQQQLAIARALAGSPRVLLLDEPTEGIQPNIIQHIGEVLSELANVRGVTIVLVEQYLNFVREFGHDFYIMNRGRVVAEGETGKLTDELVSEYLSV
jgi:urea transport system ATP-binding protein